MSAANSKLPYSKAAAKRYIAWLAALEIKGKPVVKEIWLSGSRSPLREKVARKDSDWDFIVVSDVHKLRIPNPKTQGLLFGEAPILTNADNINPKAVMVYPKDTHKVFR